MRGKGEEGRNKGEIAIVGERRGKTEGKKA